MMIKIYLISACVAASANAGWEWNPDNNPSGSRNRRMQADSYSPFDSIAGFPDINFPKIRVEIPKIEIPKIEIPKIKMPKIPKIKIPDIKMPPADIALHKEKGCGVSMVTINGETVVTVNKDGNVNTFKVPAGSSKEILYICDTSGDGVKQLKKTF